MMNQRRATSALLVSAALAIITACGDQPDDGSTNRQPAPAADPVAAWQVYYDQTHPDLDHAGKPAKSDPVAAWQVYYDQTHPDLD